MLDRVVHFFNKFIKPEKEKGVPLFERDPQEKKPEEGATQPADNTGLEAAPKKVRRARKAPVKPAAAPASEVLEKADKPEEETIRIEPEELVSESTQSVAADEGQPVEKAHAEAKPEDLNEYLLKGLKARYVWKNLRSKEPLPVPVLNTPFYFLNARKEPVQANRNEVSLVTELLKLSALAGLENRFTFKVLKNNAIAVRYKNKSIGRVYLRARRHTMFVTDGVDEATIKDLSLAECKKLLVLWIGRAKEIAQES